MGRTTVLVAMTVALMACGNGMNPNCVEGRAEVCACAGGALGTQVCHEGTFEACQCGSDAAVDGTADSVIVDTPDAIDPLDTVEEPDVVLVETGTDAARDVARVDTGMTCPDGCNDGNPCTADVCDPVVGCTHTPSSGAACSGGGFIGQCNSGTCVNGCYAMGTFLQPSMQDATHCGTNAMACQVCDDSNDCTIDACSRGGACTASSEPDGTRCSIGECRGGFCTACGFNAAPCCTGSICTDGSTCMAGTCRAVGTCGAIGQGCCAGAMCNAGAICNGTTCVRCGGSAGSTCCALGACNAPNLGCYASTTSSMPPTTASAGVCECGYTGQVCCGPGGTVRAYCHSGAVCSGMYSGICG